MFSLRFSTLAVAALLLSAAASPPVLAAGETVSADGLSVDGTAFVLKTPDGRVLRGKQLEGAVLNLAWKGRVLPVKLATITQDPDDPDILRHEFRIRNGEHGWVPACLPNFKGETWGMPVALPEGHPARLGAITLGCSGDAVGKCIRFGYKPWKKGPNGEDLTPYHAACVHMVPAAYCRSGEPHTKNGTSIDMYDDLGIQTAGSKDKPDYAFEAGWGPKGAVCVARTRWPELGTREDLAHQCPHLADTTQTCDEGSARKAGALIYNRSRLVPRIGD